MAECLKDRSRSGRMRRLAEEFTVDKCADNAIFLLSLPLNARLVVLNSDSSPILLDSDSDLDSLVKDSDSAHAGLVTGLLNAA